MVNCCKKQDKSYSIIYYQLQLEWIIYNYKHLIFKKRYICSITVLSLEQKFIVVNRCKNQGKKVRPAPIKYFKLLLIICTVKCAVKCAVKCTVKCAVFMDYILIFTTLNRLIPWKLTLNINYNIIVYHIWPILSAQLAQTILFVALLSNITL